MPPKTRSGGKAPPSRVYHETPSLRQVQFSSKKKVTYGRKSRVASAQKQRLQRLIDEEEGLEDPEPSADDNAQHNGKKRLKQQTLTQIDFVSSFEDDGGVVISDSEESEFSKGKENEDPEEEVEEEEEAEEEPRASGRKRKSPRTSKGIGSKRRRTLGDQSEKGGSKKEKKPQGKDRRKTLGDTPTSSNYHTQTLTQFMGRDTGLIQDSEDDENIEDEEFAAWLPQDLQSPEKKKKSLSRATSQPPREHSTAPRSREQSVVPQTPAKKIRFEIPSSSQLSTPATPSLSNPHMLERYGRTGAVQNSPLSQRSLPVDEAGEIRTVTPKKKIVEIKDSYATTSSEAITPTNRRTPLKMLFNAGTPSVTTSSDVGEDMGTPSKSRVRNASAELGHDVTPKAKRASPKKASPRKLKVLSEIPDSDEDTDFAYDEDEAGERSDEEEPAAEHAEPDRQRTEEQSDKENSNPVVKKVRITEVEDEIIRGHNDSQTEQEEESLNQDDKNGEKDENYAAGVDTQFALNELEPTVERLSTPALSREPSTVPALSRDPSSMSAQSTLQNQSTAPATATLKSSSSKEEPSQNHSPPNTKPLRKPILRALPTQSQFQPLESQRVPLTIIQALGTPTYRTDILLPVPAHSLSNLVSGHAVVFTLAHKIPTQVVRFWLFTDQTLRYVACVDGIRSKGDEWEYAVGQVYELNNPVDEQEMLDDGWLDEQIGRYKYIPPAVVSQLLSNLRHALFGDGAETQEEDDAAVTQLSQPEVAELPRSQYPQPSHASSFSVSQAVEAQLQSDFLHSVGSHHSESSPCIRGDEEEAAAEEEEEEEDERIPSTPLADKTSNVPTFSTPKATQHQGVRPSQATTASQASTAAPQTQEEETSQGPDNPRLQGRHAPPPPPGSSSPTFQDIPYDEESSPLFISASGGRSGNMAGMSSQLLSKSQMLPDSLVRDDEDAMLPPRRE